MTTLSQDGPRALQERLDEITLARLGVFSDLLRKWTASINLIAPSTIDTIWTRHIADSLQIVELCDGSAASWADLGTGGGLPGVVIAVVLARRQPDLKVTLVESDKRKAAFLRNVSRETGVAMTVIADRIEHAVPLAADVVSARALAPLTRLCDYAARHLAPGGTAIFLKGATAAQEIEEARRTWTFSLTEIPSRTDPAAKVLRLKDLIHA